MKLKCLSGLVVASLLAATNAVALSGKVVVKDCEGLVRAAHDAAPGDKVSVEIQFQDQAAHDATIKFFNEKRSFSKELPANQNKVVFDNILNGEWQVCDQEKKLTLSKVKISSNTGESKTSALGVLGGVGALGGAIALFAGSDSGSSDNSGTGAPLGGTTLSLPQPSGESAQSGSSNEPMAALRPEKQGAIIPDCPTNRRPDPLSPFL